MPSLLVKFNSLFPVSLDREILSIHGHPHTCFLLLTALINHGTLSVK